MSAEVLRRAAKLMRERAEAARGFGPAWFAATDSEADESRIWLIDRVTGEPCIVATADSDADPEHNYSLAQHLSGWHPTVALAVADLLDAHATNSEGPQGAASAPPHFALAIARVYLGEQTR